MRGGREVGGGESIVWARGVRVRGRGQRRGGERGGCGMKADIVVGCNRVAVLREEGGKKNVSVGQNTVKI